MVGLDDLKSLFQLEDSVILYLHIKLRTAEPARVLYGFFICAKPDMTEIQSWIEFQGAGTVLVTLSRRTMS